MLADLRVGVGDDGDGDGDKERVTVIKNGFLEEGDKEIGDGEKGESVVFFDRGIIV